MDGRGTDENIGNCSIDNDGQLTIKGVVFIMALGREEGRTGVVMTILRGFYTVRHVGQHI